MKDAISKDDSPHHLSVVSVVMFPWLGFGHIFPFVELSNTLHRNGVKVTFLSPPSLNPRIGTSLNPHVDVVNYHVPAIEGLPDGVESTFESPAAMRLLMQAMDRSKPQITAILSEISPQIVIFDFVYHWIPSLARSLGAKSVYFSVFTAFTTASAAAPPLALALMEMASPKLLAMISGLKLYEARRSIEFMRADRWSEFSIYRRIVTSMTQSSAIALKSANEIERRQIQFFSSLWRKPVLLAGALISKTKSVDMETECSEWLAKFPPRSVVFCSFGSETCLPTDQLRELVAGLESSGSPFLAVLNIPIGGRGGTICCQPELELLGERCDGKGLVKSGWVQQQVILRHPSIGAYVCHAGYGSVMEAVAGGCQLVLLPQKADQFYNAKLMVDKLKVAVDVERRYCDGWFTRKDVCNAVKKVMDHHRNLFMEFNKVRENHAKLREFLDDDEAQRDYTIKFIDQLNKLLVKTTNPKAETLFLHFEYIILILVISLFMSLFCFFFGDMFECFPIGFVRRFWN